jgi:hypothetical protein
MLSSCLLSGLIIGSVSTCVYAMITDKNDKQLIQGENGEKWEKKEKKMNYLIIFSIIMLVSVVILYFTNKSNTEVVPLKGGFSPKVNNQPPF